MEQRITLDSIFIPSEDVVARVIEDELLLVPIASGIGDMEDELYTLNDTGADIWHRLDGQATLGQVAAGLAAEYQAPLETVERDVLGLAAELAKRRMLVEVS
jgi:hypothetical protein